MRAKKYLSATEIGRHRRAIGKALRERADEWGLQGWSIIGSGDRLRIAARVPVKRVMPRAPASVIQVGNARVKVALLPTYAFDPPRATRGGFGSGVNTWPLAPGSPISVEDQERCGAGAFLSIDGQPHLVTCGHAFRSGDSAVQSLQSGALVATLTHDLRKAPAYLDAAVCELTDAGIADARDSLDAETWAVTVHRPEAADNGRPCVLWPTHEDTPSAIELDVLSFSTDYFPFCSAPAGDCSFIEVQYSAPRGDSGGPLFVDEAYYGICAGTNSHSTFFTPISSIVKALRGAGKVVKSWSPD